MKVLCKQNDFRSVWCVFLLLWSMPGGLMAQWKAETFRPQVSNVVSFEKKLGLWQRSFCFPEQAVCGAARIDKKYVPGTPAWDAALAGFNWDAATVYGAFTALPAATRHSSQARISALLYTENVSKVLFVVLDQQRGWLAREYVPQGDGFQLPINVYLANAEAAEDNQPDGGYQVSQMAIFYIVDKPKAKAVIYLGGFSIEDYESHAPGKVWPWLDSLLTGAPASYQPIFDAYSTWSIDMLKKYDHYIPAFERFAVSEGYMSGVVTFRQTGAQGPDEFELLGKLLIRILNTYPYYQEHGRDRATVSEQLNALVRRRTNMDQVQWLTALQTFIDTTFHDPHFNLHVPPEMVKSQEATRGPVVLRHVAGQVVVAAVFHPSLQAQVPVGARVLSVDGRSVSHLAPEDLNALVMKLTTDSLLLELEPSPSSAKSRVVIPYKLVPKIGENFRPRHGEVRILEDSVCYIRFNNWLGDNYYRLLNLRKTIAHSRGLIIDLRGNGGGFTRDVHQTLSLLIAKQQPVGVLAYPWFTETSVVFPDHAAFRIPIAAPVSILVDKGTACASEIFVMAMRDRPNTYVVGDDYTAGAIASPILYEFPSGVTLKAHDNIRRFRFEGTLYREGRGLAPDIWTARSHARDMRPYEDKVLRVAQTILQQVP